MTIPSFRTPVLLVALAVAVVPTVARAQPPDVDPEAPKILRRMTDYLGSLQQFTVDTQTTVEVVLTSGQKLQFDTVASVMVRRPDKLRSERKGDLVSQTFYYNGKTLTIYNPADKYYATLPAPATLDEMLHFARESLGIVAPSGDLVYSNAYELLTQTVTSAIVVGKAVIAGVKCDHVAFSRPDVDFQLWVAEGDKPLPRKYVITTKDVPEQPQSVMVMTNWNVSPNLTDARFTFVPPQGATQVDFLRLDAASASSR
jgi:hypothetical protein